MPGPVTNCGARDLERECGWFKFKNFDKLRGECLNEYMFSSLGEARAILEAWRHGYNHLRQHSSLGCLAPQKFGTGASNGY
jgi:transposase InsO family protein